ncbi:MAG: hypothetical protein A2340_12170 [Lentisphaerae bacterium RIFOXYB12_FULL_60_10]|nr:MAG: hypothetical protein A2340_12170 [Lentisphaerae bacterium RIFOXYB12_FULL_60_10]
MLNYSDSRRAEGHRGYVGISESSGRLPMKYVLVVALALQTINCMAQTTNRLDVLKQVYTKQADVGLVQYRKALEGIIKDVQKEGDLTSVLIVETELKRFDAERNVPLLQGVPAIIAPAYDSYHKALMSLRVKYLDALTLHVKKEVQAGRMEEAKAANAEKVMIEFMIEEQMAQQAPRNPPTTPATIPQDQTGGGTEKPSNDEALKTNPVVPAAPYISVEAFQGEAESLKNQTVSVQGIVTSLIKDGVSGSTFMLVLEGGLRCRIPRQPFKSYDFKFQGADNLSLERNGATALPQGTDVIVRGMVKKEMSRWILDKCSFRGCGDQGVRSLLRLSCGGPCNRTQGYDVCTICGQ